MHNSISTCKSNYYPRHVSGLDMPILRRNNCINTASGILALLSGLYTTPVESGLSPLSPGVVYSRLWEQEYRMLCLCSCFSWGWACQGPKHVEDCNVTYMLILNCALKLVEEIILYYDARSKKHQIPCTVLLNYQFLTWHHSVIVYLYKIFPLLFFVKRKVQYIQCVLRGSCYFPCLYGVHGDYRFSSTHS